MAKEKKYDEVSDFPFVRISVRAYDTQATKETGGKGKASLVSFVTDVTSSDGKELGWIGGGMGCVVISMGEHYIMISHDDLWYAVEKAMQKKGLT